MIIYSSTAINEDWIWFQWDFYWFGFIPSVFPDLIHDSMGFIAFIKNKQTKTKTCKNKTNKNKTKQTNTKQTKTHQKPPKKQPKTWEWSAAVWSSHFTWDGYQPCTSSPFKWDSSKVSWNRGRILLWCRKCWSNAFSIKGKQSFINYFLK